MHPRIETFLAEVHSLHQLEPKNLPQTIVMEMVRMSPEELFKTCTQLAVLRNNIPSKEKPVTLNEGEISSLAEEYLKELLKRFR